MKKVLSIAAISVLTALLSTGCSSKEASMTAHIDKNDESTIKTAIYIGDMKTEKAILAIEKAATKTGWRVTEFKSNAVIVEKIFADKTIARTIKVYNKHISGDDVAAGAELKDLREAIVKELQSKPKSH